MVAKLLIVDDEETNLELLSRRLKKNGYEVYEAITGLKALEVLKQNEIDLILLDIMMPDMDGLTLAKELKQIPSLATIPIIFLTAKSDIESKLEGLSLGALDYITKPFDFRELQVRIKTTIDKLEEKKTLLSQTKDLARAAYTDFLTGLPNRRHLDELLKSKLEGTSASIQLASVLMLDLDHFKRINDTYGHEKGDDILKHIAVCLQEAIGNSDQLARYGGEEFMVFLATSKEQAYEVAEQIRKKLEQTSILLNGVQEKVTISIGIAEYNKLVNPIISLASLLYHADQALYEAKKTGRNRTVIYRGTN